MAGSACLPVVGRLHFAISRTFPTRLTENVLIPVFTLTALVSSFLLFWVEPLFARLVLPLLGGSPAVWNTCLMFFQAALLGGYLYAHATSRYLGLRQQTGLHIVLLAVAFLALPVAVPAGWSPPQDGNVVGWLLLLLLVALGAPFLLLSATAPLLQRWLARQDHPSAANPYFLYAASNAGSFLGLLAFPILLEPSLTLGQQSALWSAGYALAAVLVGACVLLLWRRGGDVSRETYEPGAPAPSFRARARWVVLAFVPSSLLLGVTTWLSTDVAAVPFLWVVPLALYLLTFVIVFARTGRRTPQFPVTLHALLATLLVFVAFWRIDLDQQWAFPLHLGTFAITALVLHGELAAARPAPKYLTEYYLWLALGGALGGAFNALAAPVLFRSVVEYQAMVVLACFLRPSRPVPARGVAERLQESAAVLLPAVLLGATVALELGQRRVIGTSVAWVASAGAAAIVLTLRGRALRFGTSLAAVALAGAVLLRASGQPLYAGRSFFGAYQVTQIQDVRYLYHGTTVHGAQFTDPARRDRPLTYYHPAGPVGQVFAQLGDRFEGRQIGVVGLGAGSLLCYARPGQGWTFFEIDPLVEKVARDPRFFTFLRDCPVPAAVVLGDARLTLARQTPGRFALLVLDAFSSDAIPVHLLTREAFANYRRVLEPGGLLLVHISNQHLELEPIVAAQANAAGLHGFIAEHFPDPQREDTDLDYSCDWVLLSSQVAGAEPLTGQPEWRRLAGQGDLRPWTDDYSNIFQAIRW